MGLGRYIVDAVVLEGRSPTELARSHGISRTWIYALVKRFREGRYPALEPRSRRPRSCPHQHGPEVEAAILTLRRSLDDLADPLPPRPDHPAAAQDAEPAGLDGLGRLLDADRRGAGGLQHSTRLILLARRAADRHERIPQLHGALVLFVVMRLRRLRASR